MKTRRSTVALALASVLTAAGASAAEPIKIGVVTPLTQTYAPIGQQVRSSALARIDPPALMRSDPPGAVRGS
jgi:hypothetical protein